MKDLGKNTTQRITSIKELAVSQQTIAHFRGQGSTYNYPALAPGSNGVKSDFIHCLAQFAFAYTIYIIHSMMAQRWYTAL